MSTISQQLAAQRAANSEARNPHLIGSFTLASLFETEETAEKMKQVGDVLAALLPGTEAAQEWKRITANYQPTEQGRE
jgi:hypothetical protein